MYEAGLSLVLDSYNYKTYQPEVLPTRDYLRRDMLLPNYEDVNTMIDKTLNDFKLIIHNSKDIPMFLGPLQAPTLLADKIFVNHLLRTYNVPIDVSIFHHDESLQSLYSYQQRKCRFQDENYGMNMFDIYSKVL